MRIVDQDTDWWRVLVNAANEPPDSIKCGKLLK